MTEIDTTVLTEEQAMEAYRAVVAYLATTWAYDDLQPHEEVVEQGGASWPPGPVLCRNFEGWSSDTAWAIVWESGDYEWAYLAACGGRAELGLEVKPVTLPDGVQCDAFNSYTMSLYPERS